MKHQRSAHSLGPNAMRDPIDANIATMKLHQTMMRLSPSLFVIFCSIVAATARDNGQYENVPDHIRKWFNEQMSPETGKSCCSFADGNETQEQIRNGQYWVLIEGKWFPVPPSRVIHNNTISIALSKCVSSFRLWQRRPALTALKYTI